jgi:uncharacterized protein (TIGR03000 family)
MRIRFGSRAGAAGLALVVFAMAAGPALAQRGGGHGGGHAGGGHAAGGFHGVAPAGGFHGVAPAGGFRGVAPVGGFRGVTPVGGFHTSGFHGNMVHPGNPGHNNNFNRNFFIFNGGFGTGFFRPYYANLYVPYYAFSAYGPYYGYPYGGYDGYYPYSYGYGMSAFGSYAPFYGGLSLPAYPLVAGYGAYSGIGAAQPTSERPPPDDAVHLQLTVPENAEVWIDGAKSTQTGAVREFVSPALTPDSRYSYKITVRYTNAQGKEVEDTRQIRFQANDWFSIDFTRPAPTTPAPKANAPLPKPTGPQQ